METNRQTIRNKPITEWLSPYIWKISITVFTLSFIFFPTIDLIAAIPIALILCIFLIRFWIPRIYIQVGVLGAGILIMFTISNILQNQTVLVKDFSYWMLPLFYIIIILLSISLFDAFRSYPAYIIRFFAAFLYIQLAVAILQLINLFGFSNILEPYFQMLSREVGANTIHGTAEILSYRPGGTIGISTRLGFVAYIIGRFLTSYTRRLRYVGLAILLAIISGSRMALVTIAVTELLLYTLYDRHRYNIQTILKWIIPAGIGFILISLYHPFLNQYISALFSGDFLGEILQTRSIQHRADMFAMLFDSPQNIFIGGLVLNDLSVAAVDSELVMRTLQFGFLGYLSFKLPIFALMLRSYRIDDGRMKRVAVAFLSISILSSLTMTTSSNMYFIYVYSVLIGASEILSEDRIRSQIYGEDKKI